MAIMATSISLISSSFIFVSLFISFNKSYAFERRETIETHNLHQSLHIVQVSSLFPSSSICNPSTKGTQHKRSPSSLKLVHKYGPCSKLSNPKSKSRYNITHILVEDQSRVNSIHSRARLSNSSPDKIRDSATTLPAHTGSVVNSGNFIVTVGLGTPKKDLSLIFDTGSDLTWTQCQPCVKYCHEQKDPIFDPSKSTSYVNISCTSPVCSQLRSATGMSPGCTKSTCVYGIQYGDQSYSAGYFGKEKLTLTPTDAFDFYFGCGQNNRGLFGGAAGLLGLGRDKLSFVSQTAQKYGKVFSYCLPSSDSSSGHLTFGKSSAGGGKSLKYTKLSTNAQLPSFYFIDTVGISVGGQKLSIPTTVFSNAGTLIDSGTVITRLPATAYVALRTAFRKLMSKYPTAPAVSILDTCYDLSGLSTVAIPKISFFFSGGVEMDVDASGILYAGSISQVCLALAGNEDDSNLAIFGNVQQQTFNIVYDVAGGMLGFGPGGCA